jgi:hypothetical protein
MSLGSANFWVAMSIHAVFGFGAVWMLALAVDG